MSDPGKEEEEMEMKQVRNPEEETAEKKKDARNVEQKKDAVMTVIKEPLPVPIIQEPLPAPENLSEVFNFASSKDPDDQAAPDPHHYDDRGDHFRDALSGLPSLIQIPIPGHPTLQLRTLKDVIDSGECKKLDPGREKAILEDAMKHVDPKTKERLRSILLQLEGNGEQDTGRKIQDQAKDGQAERQEVSGNAEDDRRKEGHDRTEWGCIGSAIRVT